jgi:hypothetical protein
MTSPHDASRALRSRLVQTVDSHARALLERPEVVGVGVGTRVRGGVRQDEPCLTIFVREKRSPSALKRSELLATSLPSPAGGTVGVDVVEFGVPTAPPPPARGELLGAVDGRPVPPFLAALRTLQRPTRGGLSAAHWRFPIGTLTIGVCDRSNPGFQYALSCNHVFGRLGAAIPGDPVLQPSAFDGGTVADTFARFDRSVPLLFDGRTPEIADAALAVCFGDVAGGTVEGVGSIAGPRDPSTVKAGEWVCKVGRTTGLTYGTVLSTSATIRVDYSSLGFPGRLVFYHRQIVTTSMAAYGDSGSLLLDGEGRGLGMVFAGGDGGTVHNPLIAITTLLGVIIPTAAPSQRDDFAMRLGIAGESEGQSNGDDVERQA